MKKLVWFAAWMVVLMPALVAVAQSEGAQSGGAKDGAGGAAAAPDAVAPEPAAAQATDAEQGSLDRFIAHTLVEGNRAAMAGVTHLLPQSCPPFYLRDEFGRIITPEGVSPSGEDAAPDDVPGAPTASNNAPISTKSTCGASGCHDVGKVCDGYHFQMGRSEMAPEAGFGQTPPLDKSPGFFGKWQLLYQRDLCPKSFTDPNNIDMTAFDWVNSCGVCHPGGGPAEYDRAGRRYTEVMATEPGFMSQTYDGDYYKARWDETGVVEPDCLICHLPSYDYGLRAQNIKRLNYKWAGTVAAGLATIQGSVANKEIPKLTYRKDIFMPDGKVHMGIRRPTDRECATCHDISGIQKRGSTWVTDYMQDVHSEQGMTCTKCHHGDIRHNFAKGCSSSQTVRDDLDNTMLSCEQCHYERQEMGAPAHVHKGLPSLHIERLGCQTCHITQRPFLPTRVVDTLTGKVIELADNPGQPKGCLFGAKWGYTTSTEVDAPFESIPCDKVAVAADLTIGTDSPIRGQFSGTLPEGAFQVREFMNSGSGVADTSDKRKLMLLALQQTAQVPENASITCIFRNKAYRMTPAGVERRAAVPKPRRTGDILKSPLARSWHTVNGKEILQPEGYQLGAFWAFKDGDTIRPVFLREMKAAWDFLQLGNDKMKPIQALPFEQQEGQSFVAVKAYPGQPASGEAPLDVPNPAQATPEDYKKALIAKIKQYGAEAHEAITEIQDDNFDVWAEANTNEEIAIVGTALALTMERLKGPDLYYIRGERVFHVTVTAKANPLDTPTTEAPALVSGEKFLALAKYTLVKDNAGNLAPKNTDVRAVNVSAVEEIAPASDPQLLALAQPLRWTVSHGVEPSSMALGANGCTDCHSLNSEFFFARVMTDPFDETGQPKTVPAYERWGYSLCGIQLAALREGIVKPFAPWLVLAVLAAILLHYMVFGSKSTGEELIPDVLRFNIVERAGHLVLMVSVAYLSISGFCFLLGQHDPLGENARWLHTLCGYAAGGSFLLVTLCWVGYMLPAKGDITWLMHFGGYMGGKGHWPAGKFNAGQKVLFWITLGVMGVLMATGVTMALNHDQRFALQQIVYSVHDAAALLMILLLLGHIYLALVVNPHCVRTLFGGMVSSVWAKQHHPNWKKLNR